MSLTQDIKDKKYGRGFYTIGEVLDAIKNRTVRFYEHNRGVMYSLMSSTKEMCEAFNPDLYDIKGCIFEEDGDIYLKMADAHRRTYGLKKYLESLQKAEAHDEINALLNTKIPILMREQKQFQKMYEECSKQKQHSIMHTITNPDYNIGYWVVKILNDLVASNDDDTLDVIEKKTRNANWLSKQKSIYNQIAYVVYNLPTIKNAKEWHYSNIYYGKGRVNKVMFKKVDEKWLSKEDYQMILDAFDYSFETLDYLASRQPMVKRRQSNLVTKVGFIMYMVCDRLRAKYVKRNECVVKWKPEIMAKRIDVRMKKLEDLVPGLTGRTKTISMGIVAEIDSILLK